jgi:hypothetical protein
MIKHNLYAFTDFNLQSHFLATGLHNLALLTLTPMTEVACSS